MKKWIPSLDGHDYELVNVVVEPSEDDIALFEELQEEVSSTNLQLFGLRIVVNSGRGKIHSPTIHLYPDRKPPQRIPQLAFIDHFLYYTVPKQSTETPEV